jgi:hypothetical protein
LSVEEAQYRDAIFSAVLVPLKKLAIARNETTRKMVAVDIELKSIGASILLPQDLSIAKLHTEVETLENEITELLREREQLAPTRRAS